MSDSHPVGSDFSSDAIQCTINNQTSGTIQYNTSSKTGGNLTIDDDNKNIDSGTKVTAFSAQGPKDWMSGCGGQVTYNLPSGKDQLVVVYNVSVTGNESITFAQLQSQSGAAGSNAYFATVDPASVNGTSLSPMVTVYDTGAIATGETGCVNGPFVQITMVNQLSTWLTLNSFPNPTFSGYAVVTDGTTSVAPGGSAIVLCAFEDTNFTLTYNITSDYVLTLQQNGGDLPTAGFNVDCPYNVSVTQETVSGVDYAFTVTVSAA